MQQIPDAAVQAVKDWLQNSEPQDIEGALTAALPHLPLGYEVKNIKDMLSRESDTSYKANTPFGQYRFWESTLDGKWCWALDALNFAHGFEEKEELVLASAQADFERRVHECIIAKPVDVSAVRRQAFEDAVNTIYSRAKGICTENVAHELAQIVLALSAEPVQGEKSGITISALQSAHIERQKEWCPDQQPDLSFRGNEMAGEVGEACNVIKKLERERQGWRGSRSTKEELASELADVIHTAILCAVIAGIDLELATVEKFNATSEKNDLRTRLPAAPTSEAVK